MRGAHNIGNRLLCGHCEARINFKQEFFQLAAGGSAEPPFVASKDGQGHTRHRSCRSRDRAIATLARASASGTCYIGMAARMALLAAMAVLLMLGAASAQQEQVTVLRGSGDNATATWVLKVRPMIPSRGSRASAGGAPCTKPTQQLRLLRNCERARSCGCGGPRVMPLCLMQTHTGIASCGGKGRQAR